MRTADQVLDELAESRDGHVYISGRQPSPQAAGIAGGRRHDADKLRWRLRQPDTSESGQLLAEIQLMIVDMLAQLRQPWHHDGQQAPGPRRGHSRRTAVADDHIRLVEQGVQSLDLHRPRPGARRNHRRRAGLHEEPVSLPGMSGEPVVYPVHEPVKWMMVRADGHDDAQPGRRGRLLARCRRHSRHPMTVPRG